MGNEELNVWVCRAGMGACYIDSYLLNERIYIPWDGYCLSLQSLTNIKDFRECVIREKGEQARTTIGNWAGQLRYFVCTMQIGDYVLIPEQNSKKYILARIKSNYQYDPNADVPLHHYRSVQILYRDIPREIFPRDVLYSLGAFRSIFKVRQAQSVLHAIKTWSIKGERNDG